MHIVTQPIRRRSVRKVYLPHERLQVNGIGLGEDLSGFNIGKMFKNFIHITPRSFQPKNILGAVASGTIGVMTLGMSSALAPKLFSAHSKTMMTVGKVGAIVGGTIVGGVALSAAAPGLLTTIGSGAMNLFSGAGGLLKTFGGGLMNMFGGRGGGGGGQSAPYEQPYNTQQYPQVGQQQYYDPIAAYNANVAASAGAPLGPVGGGTYSSMPDPSQADYQQQGTELQSPDKYNLQDPAGSMIDPKTGQIIKIQPIQAGMFPDLSTTTWLVIGGVTLAGWYFLSDSKKEIGHV